MLLLEKVDAMTLAAMQAGDAEADFSTSRERLREVLNAPFEPLYRGRDLEESELRVAVGLAP